MYPIPGTLLEDQPEAALLPMLLWGEARGEIALGKLAILWVVKNRADKRGTSMKEEILRPAQFSSFNHDDPNRAKMLTAYKLDPYGWKACQAIVDVFPYTTSPVGDADHYYAYNQVSPPWGRGNANWMERAVIQNHCFGKVP